MSRAPAIATVPHRAPARRVAVAVVMISVGALAGLVSAAWTTPAFTATAQILVRDRDYASVVLGAASVRVATTPQRAAAAQLHKAQTPSFAAEVARRAGADPTTIADVLTVTGSPDSGVLVFTATGSDPTTAAAVAVTAAIYEVTSYRDQLMTGLGSPPAPGALDATQTAQLARAQAYDTINPSALLISQANNPTNSTTTPRRGLLNGAGIGAGIALLLLALGRALTSRRASLITPREPSCEPPDVD